MKPASIDERTLTPLFDIGAVWAILWARRVMVLAIAGAAVLLALSYLAVTKPSYTATASILIDPRDTRATNFNNVLPGIGSDSAAIASQVFVIQSPDLLGAVFKSQKLDSDPEFAGGGLASRLFGAGASAPQDAAFKRFQSKVSVEREGLTYVINVSFTSPSPEKAARIANAIVDQYRAGLVGERESANSDVNTLLTDRISGLQKDVSDAERTVEDFKTKHNIVNSTDGGTLQSQLDQLTTQLIAAQGDADQAKDRYNQALAAGSSPAGLAKLADILTSTSAIKLRDDYNQRATELASLQTMYGPRHPTIGRLQSELERLKRLMSAEADRIRQQLKASYDLAVQNVGKLQDKLEALRQQSTNSNIAQVQLRQLESKAQAARAVLDDYLKRAQETSQMQGVQTSEARKIGVASPPVQPTWPKPVLLLLVSAVLGLLAGCGLALALGPVSQPQEDPQSPTAAVPEPFVDRKDSAPVSPRPLPMPANFGEYRLPGVAGGTAYSNIKAIRKQLFQTGNETLSLAVLKIMRQMVLHLNDHGKPFVILVSSIHSSFEARIAGAMLGIGMQRADQNVLMVEIGDRLSSATTDGAGLFIDGATGLQTIVCSSVAEKSPGVADRNSFRGILAEAGSAFDFVLVIAPSLNENGWNPELFAKADLALLALSPSEQPSEAARLLAQKFGAGQIGRSATLVVAPADARPAAAIDSPRAAGEQRRSAAARG
ncbi:exopolysaccharide biosynthesis protein [Mesorhizobium sp. M1A.F.Ca.IN.020.06.1.1]|uniref:GumC family protein n=1 Tax=unclassified Mesorhizobium TaxID=325217 RepID=UPI000BAF0229|nr:MULTISPECIES: GumC family protein [unclassified Mesorhizobium]PBB36146.1 exopolysaccharide biosynthesis protein [Mesorhizobium sp. WSM3882]RUV06584.1 exopolysaccharide biosynthesis protein [Mesorhizobium sp. M1A.F.Ca.IN.020.03.2.1]RUV86480.1 exopolysaccharide biosynthesis protein [Mesorhizobium sp. M1A.F.Ca.IN.020.32.1.1]RUW08884.1 exopolysaccharide biosynthesis protein [Mesorhizobium sp. M1A.F.Ca.IN.022.05.2.1]RUW31800.1 exopolysaccharide biosynthesis protein [Mesorhizobium sp. M1A.F.Ca.IN